MCSRAKECRDFFLSFPIAAVPSWSILRFLDLLTQTVMPAGAESNLSSGVGAKMGFPHRWVPNSQGHRIFPMPTPKEEMEAYSPLPKQGQNGLESISDTVLKMWRRENKKERSYLPVSTESKESDMTPKMYTSISVRWSSNKKIKRKVLEGVKSLW